VGEEKPPTPLRGPGRATNELPPGFEILWASYPRKVAKNQAVKAYAKINPDEALQARMLTALQRHKTSPQWLKDDQFIPHMATWLNARRWEDELPIGTNQTWAGAL
ncbi:MAG: hypothetical protein ABMA00_13675, partial [Gemmatimonas sp.]